MSKGSLCAMGYLAFDKERKRLYHFGDRRGWPNDANHTWEWMEQNGMK